jgi:RsiW-degrading membrane proteinase PrsW (M82 family)
VSQTEIERAARAGTSAPAQSRTRRRAFLLVVFAVLLEVVLLMPFVDHLADSNNTIHFTQHGFIFGGGVLLGLAIRDVQRSARR